MRTLASPVTAALLAALLGPVALATADPLVLDYSFQAPELSKVDIAGTVYDRITMPGAPNGGYPGHPALPATGARILLPYGTDVAAVEVIPGEKISLGAGLMIEPVPPPARLSEMPDAAIPPTPDPAVYSLATAWPGTRFEQVGTYGFRGYQILVLKLQPVEYVPASGELYYYTNLTVVVHTMQARELSPLLRGLPEDAQEVQAKVDNPEQIATYAGMGVGGGRAFDLLIITTDALASAFQPLVNYHNAHGIPTEIRTITQIGSNNPDVIRNYIKDRYLYDGINYVIIGADDDAIPAKDLYVDSQWGYVEYNMPGDIYFACLDGTWNFDGDSYWGEPNDGPGGGDVDLIAEVYVGRACADNTTEVNRFVNKTIWYLNGQHSQINKVLLVGEYLGFGGVAEYASSYLNELIDGSSAHGYTTVGFPTSAYQVNTLYDAPGYDWPKSELINRINAGLHVVNHLGHGDTNYAMKLYNSDLTSSINNNDFCFVYSQTCLAGHFDGTECWAETMNIKIDKGAFAVIMNARYGWGQFNSTDGPSQRFNREFWDAVFGEGRMGLGAANHDSKEDNLYRVNDTAMRWCYYELNLFGDPTVEVRGYAALAFDFPEGIPDVLAPGVPTSFPVIVRGVGSGVPIPGSGKLYYSIDGAPFTSVFMNQGLPNSYTAILPPVNCGSTIRFYFTAQESSGQVFSNPAGAPANTYSAFPLTDIVTVMEDAFETNQGWTVYAGATTGNWERADPQEVNYSGTITQPGDDHTPNGTLCYVTGPLAGSSAGDYDVDGGPTRLTSPVLPLAAFQNAVVSYWRWFYIGTTYNDQLVVEVSNNNGSSWVTAETVSVTATWTYVEWKVSDFVTPTDQVRVRFTISDNPNDSLLESLIDDFKVVALVCEQPEYDLGDLNCDHAVDGFDIQPFVLAMTDPAQYAGQYPNCNYMLADMNQDGSVDGFDIQPFVNALTGG